MGNNDSLYEKYSETKLLSSNEIDFVSWINRCCVSAHKYLKEKSGFSKFVKRNTINTWLPHIIGTYEDMVYTVELSKYLDTNDIFASFTAYCGLKKRR